MSWCRGDNDAGSRFAGRRPTDDPHYYYIRRGGLALGTGDFAVAQNEKKRKKGRKEKAAAEVAAAAQGEKRRIRVMIPIDSGLLTVQTLN